MAVGLPTAALFRLNVPIVFFAANISIPPMIPFILYASFWMGALVWGGNYGDLSLDKMQDLEVIKTNIYQYTVGAVVLAFLAAIITGLLTFLFLKNRQRESK